ncbi:hypothetical protein VPH35_031081 [Triticum aestivum]
MAAKKELAGEEAEALGHGWGAGGARGSCRGARGARALAARMASGGDRWSSARWLGRTDDANACRIPTRTHRGSRQGEPELVEDEGEPELVEDEGEPELVEEENTRRQRTERR